MAQAGYRPRFGKDIRIKPDAPAQTPTTRPCAKQSCAGEGAYRVPKSRNNLNDHLWFCLLHARAHNESWDYFNGMNEAEIAAFQIDAMTGHRPTWPLGKRTAHVRDGHSNANIHDSFGIFREAGDDAGARRAERPLTRPQLVALELLNLDASATLHQIKARYKELVKRFHPDANGGDRGAEERLKKVIQAYGVLRASGLT